MKQANQAISIHDILSNSVAYDVIYGIHQEDVDKANEISSLIITEQSPDKPAAGDIMICLGPPEEIQ